MPFAEFYVGKKFAASDDNGGGPRFTLVDGSPVDSAVNCSVDGTGLIITNNAGNWTDVAIDDWIIWDVNNILLNGQEWRRITALPAANQITVHAVVNGGGAGGPNVEVIVGGQWSTIDHSLGNTVGTDCEVTPVSRNDAGDYPKVNIQGGFAPGVNDYIENLKVNTSGPGVYYQGYEVVPGDGCPNGLRPVVRSAAAVDLLDLNMNDKRVFVDIHLKQVHDSNLLDSFFFPTSELNFFSRCLFEWNASTAGTRYILSANVFGSHFSDCEFSMNNAGVGTITIASTMNRMVRCYFHGGDHVTYGNCYFLGSIVVFCVSVDSVNGCGLYLTAGSKAFNCIAYNNAGVGFSSSHPSCMVNNSIAMNNGTFGFSSPEGLKWSNNCAFGNTIVDYIGVGGITNRFPNCFTADPMFRNAGAGDFRLNAGSPCIGAAMLLLPFSDDIDEAISRLDIGVFQTGVVVGTPLKTQD